MRPAMRVLVIAFALLGVGCSDDYLVVPESDGDWVDDSYCHGDDAVLRYLNQLPPGTLVPIESRTYEKEMLCYEVAHEGHRTSVARKHGTEVVRIPIVGDRRTIDY